MKKVENIVDLAEARDWRKAMNLTKGYTKYIKSLSNAQLEEEINFLLKSIKGKAISNESFEKGNLIIKEISTRVHPLLKEKIQKLSPSNSVQ